MIQEYSRILVFDIETIGNISSPHFVKEMEITVVGVYHYNRDEYQTYFVKDLSELEHDLYQADLLVGFNNEHFDTPILDKYYQFDLWNIPSFDILKEFRNQTGKRVGLNSIAGASLSMYKSGSGAEAMTLYKEEQYQELADYCLDDVKLTKEVFEKGITEGKLAYTSKDGWLRLEVPFSYNLDQFIASQKKKLQHRFL